MLAVLVQHKNVVKLLVVEQNVKQQSLKTPVGILSYVPEIIVKTNPFLLG